jgi:hypothetical protein
MRPQPSPIQVRCKGIGIDEPFPQSTECSHALGLRAVIQPDERKKCKTDRRDAAGLSELLWVNRGRLLQGKPVRGLRQVDIASSTDQENRRLTTLRKEAGQDPTREHDPARTPTSQLAMGDADQDVPHPVGRGLAEASGFARDRSPGDESLAP